MFRRRAVPSTIAVTVAAAAVLAARTRRVSPAEERVFRQINGAPDALHVALWPVMQMGSLGAAFVAAGIVRRQHGDARRAMIVAGAGTAVWGGVKLIKPLVGRGRPARHLDDVRVRGAEQTGLGFPSGHAAVSMALALIATESPYARRLAVAAAAVTGIGRIYVAAHLPLDVVAGSAAGWLVGRAVSDRLGAPT
jgi:undecaprenyl-diphosphatase